MKKNFLFFEQQNRKNYENNGKHHNGKLGKPCTS